MQRPLRTVSIVAALLGGGLLLVWTLSLAPDTVTVPDRYVPEAVEEALTEAPGEASAPPARRGGPIRAEIVRVERRTVPETLAFSGRLRAKRSVELRARVTGYLAERSFEEASFVEAGDTLFRLDASTFEAAIAELAAQLDGAEADLDFLDRETERIRQLEDQSFATTSRLDELVAQREEAAARVGEIEAALERARLDLDFATVEAPFAGKVGFSEVDEGDLVTAGQTRLTTLVQHDPIEVEFRPSAGELARLRARLAESAEPIRIVVRREDGSRAGVGEISGVGPAFDAATNTIAVRATLPNAGRALVPGQFVRVTAELGARERLAVPTAALIVNQNRRALFRLGPEGKAEVVPVETGPEIDGLTAVRGDLAAGDRIVASNLQAVRPGRPVAPPADGDQTAEAEPGR